ARGATGAPRAGELEAAAPVRGRPELLAGFPVGAELVVGGALLGVLQHLVGLLHLLEARLRVRLLAHIGVVLARQPPVGGLDLIRAGGSLHAQDLVVVTEFHVHGFYLRTAAVRKRQPWGCACSSARRARWS